MLLNPLTDFYHNVIYLLVDFIKASRCLYYKDVCLCCIPYFLIADCVTQLLFVCFMVFLINLNYHIELRKIKVCKGIPFFSFYILLEYKTNTNVVKPMPNSTDNV